MAWDVEYTDEFEKWWKELAEDEQIDIDAVIGLLEIKGRFWVSHTVPAFSAPSMAI